MFSVRHVLGRTVPFNSLTMGQRLPTQLYQDQNHFLMELIQNADDNFYDDLDSGSNPLIPTLKWEKTFSKDTDDKTYDCQITLVQDDVALRYIFRRHTVKNLPSESKRQGCSWSDIALAFPIESDGRPRIGLQKVYAFLPIREYGFKVSKEPNGSFFSLRVRLLLTLLSVSFACRFPASF